MAARCVGCPWRKHRKPSRGKRGSSIADEEGSTEQGAFESVRQQSSSNIEGNTGGAESVSCSSQLFRCGARAGRREGRRQEEGKGYVNAEGKGEGRGEEEKREQGSLARHCPGAASHTLNCLDAPSRVDSLKISALDVQQEVGQLHLSQVRLRAHTVSSFGPSAHPAAEAALAAFAVTCDTMASSGRAPSHSPAIALQSPEASANPTLAAAESLTSTGNTQAGTGGTSIVTTEAAQQRSPASIGPPATEVVSVGAAAVPGSLGPEGGREFEADLPGFSRCPLDSVDRVRILSPCSQQSRSPRGASLPARSLLDLEEEGTISEGWPCGLKLPFLLRGSASLRSSSGHSQAVLNQQDAPLHRQPRVGALALKSSHKSPSSLETCSSTGPSHRGQQSIHIYSEGAVGGCTLGGVPRDGEKQTGQPQEVTGPHPISAALPEPAKLASGCGVPSLGHVALELPDVVASPRSVAAGWSHRQWQLIAQAAYLGLLSQGTSDGACPGLMPQENPDGVHHRLASQGTADGGGCRVTAHDGPVKLSTELAEARALLAQLFAMQLEPSCGLSKTPPVCPRVTPKKCGPLAHSNPQSLYGLAQASTDSSQGAGLETLSSTESESSCTSGDQKTMESAGNGASPTLDTSLVSGRCNRELQHADEGAPECSSRCSTVVDCGQMSSGSENSCTSSGLLKHSAEVFQAGDTGMLSCSERSASGVDFDLQPKLAKEDGAGRSDCLPVAETAAGGGVECIAAPTSGCGLSRIGVEKHAEAQQHADAPAGTSCWAFSMGTPHKAAKWFLLGRSPLGHAENRKGHSLFPKDQSGLSPPGCGDCTTPGRLSKVKETLQRSVSLVSDSLFLSSPGWLAHEAEGKKGPAVPQCRTAAGDVPTEAASAFSERYSQDERARAAGSTRERAATGRPVSPCASSRRKSETLSRLCQLSESASSRSLRTSLDLASIPDGLDSGLTTPTGRPRGHRSYYSSRGSCDAELKGDKANRGLRMRSVVGSCLRPSANPLPQTLPQTLPHMVHTGTQTLTVSLQELGSPCGNAEHFSPSDALVGSPSDALDSARSKGASEPSPSKQEVNVPKTPSGDAAATSEETSGALPLPADSTLLQTLKMMEAAIEAHEMLLMDESPNGTAVCRFLLEKLLELTSSGMGFIASLCYGPDDVKYLRTYAITNIGWTPELRQWYEENQESGMVFQNLDTLYGAVVKTSNVVISNHTAADSRSSGVPPGHPTIDSFLGVPLQTGEELVGMYAVANNIRGYDLNVVERLQPLTRAIGQVVAELQRRNKDMDDGFTDDGRSLTSYLSGIPSVNVLAAEDMENAIYTLCSGISSCDTIVSEVFPQAIGNGTSE